MEPTRILLALRFQRLLDTVYDRLVLVPYERRASLGKAPLAALKNQPRTRIFSCIPYSGNVPRKRRVKYLMV